MKSLLKFFSLWVVLLTLLVQPVYSEKLNPAVLYELGRKAQLTDNLPGAIEFYRAALELNPVFLQPMIGLAESFFSLEEYEEALKYVKQAKKYDRFNLRLNTLEGRIRIGLNDIEGARSQFQEVLKKEPNNLETRFGLAELDIASGKTRSAAVKYMETLEAAPQNRRALLSLALLHEAEGNISASSTYIELALKYHGSDAQVNLEAGRIALSRGELPRAEKYLLTAIALDSDLIEARRNLAYVFLKSDRSSKAASVLEELINRNREDVLSWFMLGLAFERLGETLKAINSLSRALRVRPDDEVSRIAMENIALAKLPLDDKIRKNFSDYHLKQGSLLEDKNLLDKALYEYRRSLRLNPESKKARLAYAEIFRTRGFITKFSKELEVLKSLGYTDNIIQDSLEATRGKRYDQVSVEWGIDQYAVEKDMLKLGVYTLIPANREIHPTVGEISSHYFIDMLQKEERFDIVNREIAITSFKQAFRASRELDIDYFIILSCQESERSFSIWADLFLGGTGARLNTMHIFRTANDRVRNAFLKLASKVEELFPLRARLLTREFDRGVVDLGRLSGVKEEDNFIIIKKGKLRLKNDSIGFLFAESDVLGEFTVTRTDENLSEGIIIKKSFFDRINQGDILIAPPPTDESGMEEEEERDQGLLYRLFALFKPKS
ncbi:MAG TPA: tetratricopeptide repeat protein [Spirochaetales bacterium]|nr:tetratricopeptide repeat protein [Spirochaetales bacterium]